MAVCQNSNERLFGGAIVLEVADGCPDVKPAEVDWLALAAGTSKGFDFSPNSTTSDADDGAGYVETIVTNSDFTISFDGEVRKGDKLDQYGVGKFIKYFHSELQARRQPGLWVRMDFGPVRFTGYMVVTALSADGGTNDIVTFTTEFKVGAAETIEVVDAPTIKITTDLNASLSVVTGAALNLTVVATGGTGTLKYMWYKDKVQVATQTTATFNKANAQAADSGSYSVVVSDNSGQVAASKTCVVTVS